MTHSLLERKQAIRKQAIANRSRRPNKDEISRVILGKFFDLPEYSPAHTVMFYVHTGSEVRTQVELAAAVTGSKRIVVPYCVEGQLQLFHLEQMHELQPGSYQILEPGEHLRSLTNKAVDIQEVDIVMVPGVAFDRCGTRLGVGKGYYDKLLLRARPDAMLVGLAFECQVFDELPLEPHDVVMDRVITESAVYHRMNRLRSSSSAISLRRELT